MLTCQFVGHLPQVNRHEVTLLPEAKELLGDAKGSAKPVETLRLQLTQSLENGLDMLFGLEFLSSQTRLWLVFLILLFTSILQLNIRVY